MARTQSNMLPLGTIAPNFNLTDTISNTTKNYNDIKGTHGTVIMFICNHCPYVHHVIQEIIRIVNDYRVQGIGFAAINSNDIVEYPDDSPEKMVDFAFEHKFSFPYLFDETQEIAKKYDAACTPDFYVFNAQNHLIYRGQLDDSRPQNTIATSGSDLRNAIDSILYNRSINTIQKPSLGCNIKWKKIM